MEVVRTHMVFTIVIVYDFGSIYLGNQPSTTNTKGRFVIRGFESTLFLLRFEIHYREKYISIGRRKLQNLYEQKNLYKKECYKNPPDISGIYCFLFYVLWCSMTILFVVFR